MRPQARSIPSAWQIQRAHPLALVVAAWQRQGGIKNAWRGRRQQPGPLSQARPRGRALPSAIESLSYLGRAAVPLPGNADGPRPNASAAAHEGGHRRRPTRATMLLDWIGASSGEKK